MIHTIYTIYTLQLVVYLQVVHLKDLNSRSRSKQNRENNMNSFVPPQQCKNRLNIMCAGESGQGKSTFLTRLLQTYIGESGNVSQIALDSFTQSHVCVGGSTVRIIDTS